MKTEIEDWLTELPPLDGGEEDDPAGDADAHEDLIARDEGEDGLDDAASEGLVVDDGILFGDEQEKQEAEDGAWEADVGEPELDIDDGEAGSDGDADSPGLADGDVAIEDEPAESADDGGEEGTSDPVDQGLEGDLPDLDADDHGDFEDVLLRETGLVEADLEDAELPRWADAAWTEHSSRALPMWTRATSALVFDPRPGGAVVLLARDEGLLVSTDGGVVAQATNGWRAALEAQGRGQETLSMVALAPHAPKGAARTLWGATAAGLLLQGQNLGAKWEVTGALLRSPVGIAVSQDGSLTALCKDAAGLELLTSLDGAKWFTERLPIAAGRYGRGPPPWLVRSGVAVAVGHGSGVVLSRDGARSFSPIPGTSGAVAAAFAGEGSTAPLVVLVRREAEGKAYLIRSTREGQSEVVGELGDVADEDARGAEERDGAALLWDAVAGLLWVAFLGRASAWR
jgi:hypothetical protein